MAELSAVGRSCSPLDQPYSRRPIRCSCVQNLKFLSWRWSVCRVKLCRYSRFFRLPQLSLAAEGCARGVRGVQSFHCGQKHVDLFANTNSPVTKTVDVADRSQTFRAQVVSTAIRPIASQMASLTGYGNMSQMSPGLDYAFAMCQQGAAHILAGMKIG